MSNSNDIWNSILSMNTEQPKEEVKPVIQPIVQPEPNLMNALNTLLKPTQEIESASVTIEDTDEDVEGYEDEDVSIPETNLLGSFNLDGPVAAPIVQPVPFTFDLNLGTGGLGTGLGTIPVQEPTQEVKRGRGRPPKAGTAQDVINLLPNSLNTEEQKRTGPINTTEVLPPINTSTTEVVTTIPKKLFTELAESLLRISQTLRELGKE